MTLTFTDAIADLRTLYVYRPLLNADDVITWAKANGFATTLTADDMHVTVARSKTPVDWDQLDEPAGVHVSNGGKRRVKPLGPEGAVVLRFDDDELHARWREFKDDGAKWDWPSYQPHVTITYGAGEIDLAAIPPYTGPLIFGPEVFEEITEGWADTITEKTMDADAAVVAYLKTSGAYNAIAAAAGVAKDMGVGDVHVASSGKGKKPPAPAKAYVQGEDDEPKKVAKAVEVQFNLDITKADADQQLVFGWASISSIGGKLVVDKQGDTIPISALEPAAYDFLLWGGSQGDMHQKKNMGRPVECMMFTAEKAALGLVAKNDKGEVLHGWWLGFRVEDPELWKLHKAGQRPEFSIGGRAMVTETA